MKKITTFLFICLSIFSLKSQNFYMCSGTNSTAVSSATISDAGGQFSNYYNFENCQFLISPSCNGTVSLTFSQFSTEGCCDFLTVYDGSTTAAPSMGVYSGTSLPPVLNASSGQILLVWFSNSSITAPGFVATWTVLTSGLGPVANFSVNNSNPPLGGAIQFTDLSTNSPNSWNWDFGDGTFSTLQNPVKTYTTSGLKTVTLTAANCSTNGAVTNTVLVQSAPSINISPGTLSATAVCGGSVTTTATITNAGSGPLTYTLSGATGSSTVQVLCITNYVDMLGEYPIMINSLNNYFTSYSLTQHNLTSPATFSAALNGKHVLLIPEQETYSFGFMQTYSATILNFVSSGGTAILCGTGNANQINDVGLFNATVAGYGSANSTVIDTNDVIMKTMPMGSIFSPNATYYANLTNPGITNFVTYGGVSSVVCKRVIGSGRAIYLAYDYFATSVEASKVLANSIKSSMTAPVWFNGGPSSGTVAVSGSSTITFTFSAAGLTAGTYTYNALVNSNDPSLPTVTVPVTFSVGGTASSSVAISCINFGSIMQNTNKLDSMTLYNTGCATLSVTSLSSTNPAFTHTPSASFTVAAFSSKKIYVNFNPTLVGAYTGTLNFTTNGGNQSVCLTGNATAAPSISVSPTTLTASLPACNATQTVNLIISNTGGTNLNYSLSGSNTSANVKVLVITNYVDMFGEYPNMITGLNAYFTNYTITQHNLTSVSAFSTALNGKQVLLIPEQETYVTGFMQTYSATINSFASAGGIVIQCGTGNLNQTNDIGLFMASSSNWTPPSITVVDTNDVIMKTLPMGAIFPPNATFYNTWTTAGVNDYIKYGTSSVVSKRSVGAGKAIYLGFDYYSNDINTSKLLANSVKSANNGVSWLSASTSTGLVTPGASSSVTYTFNTGNLTAGTYTYNVLISSNDPLTPTFTVPVSLTVGSNPCAAFTFNNPNNCTGVVSFTQNVVNTVTSYSWNFGNGNSSTSANPTNNYTSAGNYTVTLTACNGTACSTAQQTLNIANVGGPVSAACTPTNLYFASNYGIMNVTFNTINKSSGYTSPEGYQDFSCLNQTTLTIGSTYLLNVSTNPLYNENCSVWIDFDNNGSFSAGEQIMTSLNKLVTHTVNFTPPTTAVLNTPLRMRVINDASGYMINGACNNLGYGQAEDYSVKIQPNNVPPVANYNSSTNSCAGIVSFNDMSMNQPTSWVWNFGDGGASTQQNPVHTYTSSGTFSVTLVASNAFGSSFYTTTITVNPLVFTIGYTGAAAVNNPLTFTTSLSGGLVYTWDFGDGNLSGLQTANNTYTAAGTYTVKLTIVSGGCANTVTTTITIGPLVGIASQLSGIYNIAIYPNPFSKETNVKLNISENSKVKVDLINSVGQLVRSINEAELPKGEHIFNLSGMPPGIYFLKVSAEGKTQTHKLVSVY
ncbi:MAG: hypothetical protein K0S32_1283 [Bacteroidetes bacterium]|jgi:PKD repeat protein|nr:hypothetical protein [Bacteroidota bacterium]